MRVTLNADNIPATFPVRMATTILDYDYTDISGHQFLLPLKSETQMSADGVLVEATIRNSGCIASIPRKPRSSTTSRPTRCPRIRRRDADRQVDCKDPKNAKDPTCKK